MAALEKKETRVVSLITQPRRDKKRPAPVVSLCKRREQKELHEMARVLQERKALRAREQAELVRFAEWLLIATRNGTVTGLVMAYRREAGEHFTAHCGAYRNSLDEAVCASALLARDMRGEIETPEW